NSGDIKVFDAIKIEGEPMIPDTNNLIVPDSADIVVPYYKMPYYEIPNADSDGNLMYYNSFGVLEERKVHPYYDPIEYPDDVGKDERHDDGFYDSLVDEESNGQIVMQKIIGEKFVLPDDPKKEIKFYYPSNVGKLDRENKELLNLMKELESHRAMKILGKTSHN
ncbi:MAG: hypothetical protein ACT4N5_07220, partial [Nitrosopumilaceae archaeon]